MELDLSKSSLAMRSCSIWCHSWKAGKICDYIANMCMKETDTLIKHAYESTTSHTENDQVSRSQPD
ncbi:hypothetical protein BC936DRAFT_138914 [Jimgerdemannia flammicorona]|uniref:Uncharacterized protein n=1 Tax=Jimgerdemannia flammicorona TaxID=994334 RepID=A0A433BDV6_9FUNG|nr:hypothetical protein BC936DRAFT_138914 [Jimgerdemannia flammicorona]